MVNHNQLKQLTINDCLRLDPFLFSFDSVLSRGGPIVNIRCPAMDICEPHRKHLFCYQAFMFIGPLPSSVSTWHTMLNILTDFHRWFHYWIINHDIDMSRNSIGLLYRSGMKLSLLLPKSLSVRNRFIRKLFHWERGAHNIHSSPTSATDAYHNERATLKRVRWTHISLTV
jgi:hypothetical protein